MTRDLLICLHSGRRPIGRIVRWFTHSKYSHCSLLLPDGRHVEAREFKGVVAHPKLTPKGGEKVDFFRLEQSLSPGELDILTRFVDSTLGEPYDWRMIWSFALGSLPATGNPNAWYCSEWAYSALLAAGRPLLHRDYKPWMVAPGHLALSPLIDIIET